jgi:hypothetical protein
VAAIFYFVPYSFPFLAPGKWTVAISTNFLWQMFFFYASHKSIMHLTGNERNLFSMNANISAVLDLGTNTFHLLVVECSSDGVKPLSRLQIPVKLGEGGINKGFIEKAAYQRGQSALLIFAQELKKYAVKSVKAFATSAIRDASNGAEFIAGSKD